MPTQGGILTKPAFLTKPREESYVDYSLIGGGGFGWVRFKSGLQIVFNSGSADGVNNFPVAFTGNPRIEMTSPTTGGSYVGVPGWYERTNTYFKGNVYDPRNREFIDGNFDYIAIGFWK